MKIFFLAILRGIQDAFDRQLNVFYMIQFHKLKLDYAYGRKNAEEVRRDLSSLQTLYPVDVRAHHKQSMWGG